MEKVKRTTIIKIDDAPIVVTDLPEVLQRAVSQMDDARENAREMYVELALADNAIEAITAKIRTALEAFEEQRKQDAPTE